MADLLGERDAYLNQVDAAFAEAKIVARGNEIVIADFGDPDTGEMVETVFDELLILIQEGESLDPDSVERVIEMVKQDVPSPSGVFTDSIKVGRGKHVRPKTHGQKKYVDAVRENTMIFSIGPAGTGKTYLAMACAIEALQSGSVRRITLRARSSKAAVVPGATRMSKRRGAGSSGRSRLTRRTK